VAPAAWCLYEWLSIPNFFDTFTLTQKQVTGPGLPSETWNFTYHDAQIMRFADQCQVPASTGLCPESVATEVAGPDSLYKRYWFGAWYGVNEGQLLGVDTGTDTSHILQSVTTTYADATSQSFPDVAGRNPLRYSDALTSAGLRPQSSSVITQDGATFATTVNTFDAFARATSETETGTGIGTDTGATSRTEATTYADDTSRWVLGMVKQKTINGTTTSKIDYDSLDRPTSESEFGKPVWTKIWNVDGTLASVADGKGNTTHFYDWHRGLPQTVKFADNTTKQATVDDNGWITALTDQTENGPVTTHYAYDLMGRLKQIDHPSDSTNTWSATKLSFGPIGAGQYGTPTGIWVQKVQTGSAVTNIYFDALWRPLVSERYDSANIGDTRSLVVHLYDAAGRTIFTSYPVSNLGTYTQSLPGTDTGYDALNRVTTVVQDTELGQPSTTLTDYLSGFKTKVTDPRGYSTTTSYYAWGSPDTSMPYQITAQVDQTATTTTTITRDIFGKPVWIARNGTTYQAFIYDGYQQLCKHLANGIVTFDAWDDAGNLQWSAQGVNNFGGNTCSDVTQANAAGHVVSRLYDARNRLKALSFPGGIGNQTWTYTPDGLPDTVVTDNGSGPQVTNSYLYDARRLMISEALTVGNQFIWAVGYGYDANGHLSVRFTPSGQYYYTSPDALGQPTMLGIQNVNTYVYNVTHYPDGHIASFNWTSGLSHQVTENVRGLPSEIHDSMQGVDAEDLAYSYDADGNTKTMLDYADGARSASMNYDGLDRLTSAGITAIGGGVPTSYQYNALDQLTEASQGTHIQTFTYGSYYNDELAQVVDNQSGTTTFGYDAQGNLASRNGLGYAFDAGNRLRNVTGEEGGYAYDAWGRRVAQTDVSGTIYSFYDRGGQLIFQRDRTGGTHDYLYLGGHLVAIRDYDTGGIARVMRYQHTDALGSVIRQTDSSGAKIAADDRVYDAWGGIHGSTPQDGPGYTGHVEDADTNLVYMQQRYYDPSVGRFLSMDPVDASGTDGSNLDRYWYANDNPYRYTDPDGQQTTGEFIDEQAQAAADSGNDVATYAWAFAGTVWGALGAESVSQVADKGAGASTGDKVMAAITIVTLGKGEEAVTAVKDVAKVAENGSKEAVSMSKAVDKAIAHTGSDAKVGMTKGGNVQFSKSVIDQSGNTITKNARFDVNPSNAHVRNQGPHLNIETQQNGKVIQNDHIPIDPKTIRPGDHGL